MQLTDLNRTQEIGASCFWVTIGPFELAIDAGLSPKAAGNEAMPDYSKLQNVSLDAIFLTHCHLDHVGSLPVLIRKQPQAAVYASQVSAVLAPRILKNSHRVMFRQREEQNILEYPLFTSQEIRITEDKLQARPLTKPFNLHKDGEHLEVTFYPGGHLPGAIGILFKYKGRRIFFTGDTQFEKQFIVGGAHFPKGPFDCLVLETTRGATEVPPEKTRKAETERLLSIIQETLTAGGDCLIPVFALGRMQEIFAILHKAYEKGKLPKCNIYGSGLGMDLVDMFETLSLTTNQVHFRKKIVRDLKIKKLPKRWSPEKRKSVPNLYVLSSGMLVANTPSYRVASALLDSPHNTLCFVGYCAPDTPGGALLETPRDEPFLFEALDLNVPRKARVEHIDLSGHANREALLQFAIESEPRAVVLSHGDPDARAWFTDSLIEHMPKTKLYDPEPDISYEI